MQSLWCNKLLTGWSTCLHVATYIHVGRYLEFQLVVCKTPYVPVLPPAV